MIKSGTASKSELTNETSKRNCGTKSEENNSITCDNELEEKTPNKSDKDNEEAVNARKGLPNIYECGKNIYQ